ncbi:MAG: acyl carrier protein [Solobacterium sp.]|nr:acyl carrier protein [Solobacterium sp.]
MEELMEVLQDVKDDVDFENETRLIDDGILDSFDLLQIIASLNDTFDISIPASEIVPANFNSAKAMYDMVQRLAEEG